jgi:hypothetical protein
VRITRLLELWRRLAEHPDEPPREPMSQRLLEMILWPIVLVCLVLGYWAQFTGRLR